MPRGTIRAHLQQIRVVFFDFDGVFTDNRVLVSEEGKESVLCYRSDGIGLAALRGFGIKAYVISTEANPVVVARAAKLKIECRSGCANKASAIREILSSLDVEKEQAAFVGNDVNDLEAMELVGFPVAVADAFGEVKRKARLKLRKRGGWGAVREFCDLVCLSRKGQNAR